MKSLTCLLGLLVAAASGLASAAQAPAALQPAETKQRVTPATAAELARIVAPIEIMLPAELEQARKVIVTLPTVDEDARQLEQDYPGLYAALWTAVEPEMRRATAASYPGYWAALEQIYVARLTENEAQAVMTFFKSPTGQKLIRNMYGNFDAAPMVAEMVKSENYTIDEQQMKAATDAARAKAVSQIGQEDQADLWILVESIDLEKFKALGAETQKVTLAWVNQEDPEGDAMIGSIMEEAMQQYMASHPAKE